MNWNRSFQKLQPKFTLGLFWAIWLATQKISTNHYAQNYRSKTFIGKFSFWLKPWGLCSIRLFIYKVRPFCCKLWNLGKLWANLLAKFGRSYKSVIYGSVKFYGTGPWWWFMWKRRRTRRLFLLLSVQYSWQYKGNIKFANDCIQTTDLCCLKRPLYQLSHNQCPNMSF